jgi:hypothetical protein
VPPSDTIRTQSGLNMASAISPLQSQLAMNTLETRVAIVACRVICFTGPPSSLALATTSGAETSNRREEHAVCPQNAKRRLRSAGYFFCAVNVMTRKLGETMQIPLSRRSSPCCLELRKSLASCALRNAPSAVGGQTFQKTSLAQWQTLESAEWAGLNGIGSFPERPNEEVCPGCCATGF